MIFYYNYFIYYIFAHIRTSGFQAPEILTYMRNARFKFIYFRILNNLFPF